jgi:hypothetical protein
MGRDRGKKDQEREQSKNEVVRKSRSKRQGVILFHVANHSDCSVLEVE